MQLWSLKLVGKRTLLYCLLLLMLVPPLLQIGSFEASAQTTTNLSDARVAIYHCQRYDNYSFTACIYLFEWMNTTVELISGQEIQQGALRSFDLLVLPAFGPSSYERELTPIGKERIRQFLATGGSLFTVCRGTEFAVICLGLIDATLHYIGPAGVQCHDTHNGELAFGEMNVNHDSTGPDLSQEPDSYMVFCTGASYFEVLDSTEVIPILSYAESGLPGVIVFQYGLGTVMLSSPHPEFEEGNTRDGLDQTSYTHWPTYQFLQDPDSEWDLLRKVTSWLISTSPKIPEHVYLGALALVGSVFVAIIVVILVPTIKIRR